MNARTNAESDHRRQVILLFGGRSGEHEVSQSSAKSVFDNIDRDRFSVTVIGITKEGEWVLPSEPRAALSEGPGNVSRRQVILPADYQSGFMEVEDGCLRPLVEPDIVFPVLHGPYGEDGTVQGLLELADVAYVGAGVLGSAVGMDKVIMKRVFRNAGLETAAFTRILRPEWRECEQTCIDSTARETGFPCFVKPANLGSSVGITKVSTAQDLPDAFRKAFEYDTKVIIEESIEDAHEVECSILGNEQPQASVIGEVIPSDEFYSYRAKYIDASELSIPAPLPDEVSDRVRRIAIQAFEAVAGSGLARVDFLVKRDTHEVFVSEVNTMPGFTEISMYPKLWEASGVSYTDLLTRLIELGIERYQQRASVKTSYE